MFKATASVDELKPDNKLHFQVLSGESPVELMNRTGFGNIKVIGVSTVDIDPETGQTIPSETNDKKKKSYLKNVPWVESGYQSLSRLVDWVEPVQNTDYAQILMPLSEKYQLQSFTMAGSKGEWVIWQFKMPEFYVERDPNGGHSVFLTIGENRANGIKFFGNVITRLFCTNQFTDKSLSKMRRIVNGSNASLMLDVAVFLEEARIRHLNQLNELFKIPVKKSDVDAVANALFGKPEIRKTAKEARRALDSGYSDSRSQEKTSRLEKVWKDGERDYLAAVVRHEAHTTHFNNLVEQYTDELGSHHYALWQAATDNETHSPHYKSSEEQHKFNLLFGKRASALEDVWSILTK